MIFGTSQEVETGAVDFFGRGFQVGLSGGTFGWDFRVGREDYVSRPRLSSRRGNGAFGWDFRARGRCQLDHVVFAAGKQGGGTFLDARTLSAGSRCLRKSIFIWALLCRGNVGKHEDNVREGSGREVRDLGGIVYFATGICSFCRVLRGRSAGFE